MNSIVEEDMMYITKADIDWHEIEGKVILITGANGMLPSYLVKTVLYLNEYTFANKTKIYAIVRNKAQSSIVFKEHLDDLNLEIIEHDVCQEFQIDGEIDYIIHAASQASPKYYSTDPVGTLSANVMGTYNLLNLAVEKKVSSFLYFSSSEIYGVLDDTDLSIGEEDIGIINPLDIRSCYAESKRMSETMCRAWAHQFEVPVKIVRPFHTYGPGMKLDDGRVFADFVSNMVNRKDIVMKSDGKQKRSFCYISDATIGYFTVLLKGKNGEAYNIGNSKEEVSIGQLAERLVNLSPELNLKVIKQDDRNSMSNILTRSCPDIAKASLLGWVPHIGIDEGFRRTIESFLIL